MAYFRRKRPLSICLLLMALVSPHLFKVAAGFSTIRDALLATRAPRLSTFTLASDRSFSLLVCGAQGSSDSSGADEESSSTSDAADIATKHSSMNRKARTNIAITTLVVSVTALAIAAKYGILPGPIDMTTGDLGVYTDGMILRDVGATLLSTVLAFLVVKLIIYGFDEGYYNSKISRKLSHTCLAPFFMLVYPIFSPADGARFFAAVVTLVNAVRLYLAGSGGGESSLAKSVSRSGDSAEALGGPFIYVCLLTVFILAFWRSNMIGIVAASTMAAGDGMADLVGRKFGKDNKWWFSDSKSVAGTVAFVVSASFTSYGLVNWFQYTGCLQIALSPMDLALRITAISVLCAIVELLPIGDDNFTVPLSAAALAALLLR